MRMHKCIYCQDTGNSYGDIDGPLDCARCDVAVERMHLNNWAYSESIRINTTILWQIYQHGKKAVQPKES